MAPAQGHGSLARERIEERAEQVSQFRVNIVISV
jgi:hypothetical protein